MTQVNLDVVRASIRNIPDFPKPGIQFKDVTTAFKEPDIFRFVIQTTADHYRELGITQIVGVESRGFILGSALAYELNTGFIPVRKPGKLPAETYQQSYELEYGKDTLEMHVDALSSDDVVLIHDDLLATGGTVGATIELVRKFGVRKIYANFFVELDFLNGKDKIDEQVPVWSLIHY